MVTIQALWMAVWDADPARGAALKGQLDLFGARETVLYTQPFWGGTKHDVFFLSFDECGEPALHTARAARLTGEQMFLLLVSDRNQDLLPFLRPQIRPGGVLFRPVQNAHIRRTLNEIVSEMDRLALINDEDCFTFSADGVVYNLRYRDIFFFEAMQKKVHLHTAGQVIGYYDAIERLVTGLPPYFVRCHRSFIVNTKKIVKFARADMMLHLTGGDRIPVSRSYRDAFLHVMVNTADSEP